MATLHEDGASRTVGLWLAMAFWGLAGLTWLG